MFFRQTHREKGTRVGRAGSYGKNAKYVSSRGIYDVLTWYMAYIH